MCAWPGSQGSPNPSEPSLIHMPSQNHTAHQSFYTAASFPGMIQNLIGHADEKMAVHNLCHSSLLCMRVKNKKPLSTI